MFYIILVIIFLFRLKHYLLTILAVLHSVPIVITFQHKGHHTDQHWQVSHYKLGPQLQLCAHIFGWSALGLTSIMMWFSAWNWIACQLWTNLVNTSVNQNHLQKKLAIPESSKPLTWPLVSSSHPAKLYVVRGCWLYPWKTFYERLFTVCGNWCDHRLYWLSNWIWKHQ